MFLEFKTSDLRSLLKGVASILKDMREVYTRCVMIDPMPNRLCRFTFNAGDVKASVLIPYESAEPIDHPFVFEYKSFVALWREDTVRIDEEYGTYRVKALDGFVDLDYYNLGIGHFYIDFPKMAEAGVELQPIVEFSKKAMGFAVRSDDKRVCIRNGIAYYKFMSSAVSTVFGPNKSFGIRTGDLPILTNFVKDPVQLKVSGNRIMIWNETSFLDIPNIDVSDFDGIEDYFCLTGVGVSVDSERFKSVISLIWNTAGLMAVMRFELRGEHLFLCVRTRTGRVMEFDIGRSESCLQWKGSVNPWYLASQLFRSGQISIERVDQDRVLLRGKDTMVILGNNV